VRWRVHNGVRDVGVSFEFTNINTQAIWRTPRFRVGRFGKKQAYASGFNGIKCIANGGCLLPNYSSLNIFPLVMIPILKAGPFLGPGHHGAADHSTIKIADHDARKALSYTPFHSDVRGEVHIAHRPVAEETAIVDLGRLVFGDNPNRFPR
jgi:hypothetical protein